MAWLPIAYTVPQYLDSNGDPASGYVLKAYQVGTTTNIPFATTNEGTTTENSIALNSNGYPEVSGNVVIPHMDQDYKLALYPSQSAADSDTGAVWTVDDIDLIQTTDTATSADYNVWPLTDYGGAYFDGSNDYLTRGAGLTGASDGKKGTIVAFVSFDNSASAIEYIVHSTGGAFILRRDSDGVIRVIAENSGGTTILNMATSNAYETADTVYCIMASWDLATPGSNQLYVNDTSDVVTTTFTNDTIDYTVADWAIGADVGGSNKITGNILSVWFDPTDNLDFDTETNRRKFLDEQSSPVFLGVDGDLPTKSTPILFLYNDDTAFELNRGSGGDFTENGTLASSTVTFDGQYSSDNSFSISGYDKGRIHYIEHEYASTTARDILNSASQSVWGSIGPTGSGANLIWTALDNLPSNTKAIIINIFNRAAATSSASGVFWVEQGIYLANNDVTSPSPDDRSVVSVASANGVASAGSQTLYGYHYVQRIVPVDSNYMFQFNWSQSLNNASSAASDDLKFYLAGWIA